MAANNLKFRPPLWGVRSRWLLLSGLYATALIHLAAYIFQPDKPISRALQVLFLGVVLLALAVLGLAFWLNEARAERIRLRLQPLAWPVAVILLVGLAAYGISMRTEWVYAHLALVFAATAANVLLTFFNNALPIANARLAAILAIVAAAVLVVRAYGLWAYPAMNEVDEPWVLSWAVSVAQKGYVSDLLMLGVDGEPTYFQSHWAWPLGLWLRAVGATFWHARLFHLLVLMVVIGMTAMAARNLYGGQAALFTAGAMFTSAVAVAGLRVRHDIGLMLALVTSIWLVTEALRRQRSWLHLVAGVVMGWGMFAHYHALLLAPAVGLALYLPQWVSASRETRRQVFTSAVVYGVGIGIGFACVVVVQILPDVETFLALREPRSPRTFSAFVKAFFGHLSTIALHSQWELLLVGAAAVAAVIRRRMNDGILLALLTFCHLALAAVSVIIFDYHIVPLAPIYALLVGSMLANGIGVKVERTHFAALAIGFCALMPGLGATVDGPLRYLLSRQPVIPPAPPVAAWIREHLPADTTILGEHLYYLWLQDYRYASPYIPEFTPPAQRARYADPMDQWDDMGIDVLILDPTSTSWGLFEKFAATDYLQTRHFERVAEFPNRGQMIEVWQRME